MMGITLNNEIDSILNEDGLESCLANVAAWAESAQHTIGGPDEAYLHPHTSCSKMY